MIDWNLLSNFIIKFWSWKTLVRYNVLQLKRRWRKKYIKNYIEVWIPHFGLCECVSHSNGELAFWFGKIDLIDKKNDLESQLIFVLFLKGKQNKKEKP